MDYCFTVRSPYSLIVLISLLALRMAQIMPLFLILRVDNRGNLVAVISSQSINHLYKPDSNQSGYKPGLPIDQFKISYRYQVQDHRKIF